MWFLLFLISIFCATYAFSIRKRGIKKQYEWLIFDIVPIAYLAIVSVLLLYMFQYFAGLSHPRYIRSIYGSISLFLVIPLFFFGKKRAVLSGILVFFLSILVLVDTIYYRYFQTLIPIMALSFSRQIWDTRDSVADLIQLSDFWYVFSAIFGVMFGIIWPSKIKRQSNRAQFKVNLIISLIIFIGIIVAFVDVVLIKGDNWRVYSWDNQLQRYGIYNTHNIALFKDFKEWRELNDFDDRDYQIISNFLDQKLSLKHDVEIKPVAPKANLLLIQVESLQEWVIGTKVNGQEITPYLNKLADSGYYFPNIWDQTASSHTADGEYLVMNSQHPLNKGSVYFRRAENQFVSLPWLLSKHDYFTISAHGYKSSMWNRSVIYPVLGFKNIYFQDELGEEPKIGLGLSDIALSKKTINIIKDLNSPWMSFVITLTNHHPFDRLSEENRFIDVGRLSGSRLGNYIELVRYTDESIKILCEGLREKGKLDNTMVAIYGDHSAMLSFNYEIRKIAYELIDLRVNKIKMIAHRKWPIMKVPFILYHPKISEPLLVNTAGGQIDIAPTILYHLGFEKSRSMFGEPLLGQDSSIVKWDGSAANQWYMLKQDKEKSKCWDFDYNEVDMRHCEPLLDEYSEIEYSWSVTLHNLAMKLHLNP
ncbi:LTA synthase family protein [Myxococcota bacterium]|nr:LTA synthase family protein [Myxococcota bacterium]MBU1430197.1 LTA synthase family protein [Myxococcota bacterium]MBU1897277.1 LTA synthase family protein [Myxococcota bacterium]